MLCGGGVEAVGLGVQDGFLVECVYYGTKKNSNEDENTVVRLVFEACGGVAFAL